MQTNSNTNIDRIIAKIDNDFNPDNSDWIPRVAAWCIQAMQMLDALSTEKVKTKVKVVDRIAISPYQIDKGDFSVYDTCGNKLKQAEYEGCNCTSPSTGEEMLDGTSNTTVIVRNDKSNVPGDSFAETIVSKDYDERHIVHNSIKLNNNVCEHNYVIIGDDKVELNFDTDCIIIETNKIKTTISDVYGCEVPVIPNNGILIEALGYYCIYKMLCRGYKHPVFNLAASQYGTNPYWIWTQLKDEARRSVINDKVDIGDSGHLFRSNLFISTFDSRH